MAFEFWYDGVGRLQSGLVLMPIRHHHNLKVDFNRLSLPLPVCLLA